MVITSIVKFKANSLDEKASMELADEAYIKHCMSCGKKVEKPVLYKGYVFCSQECLDAFKRQEK